MRALTWWILGAPLLGIALARQIRPGHFAATWSAHTGIFLWTAFTITLSCLLMFVGGHAVIHQSSYTVMLALFILSSAWLELGYHASLLIVALLQTVTLVTTYAVSNAVVNGPVTGLPFALVAGAALAAVITAERVPAALYEQYRQPARAHGEEHHIDGHRDGRVPRGLVFREELGLVAHALLVLALSMRSNCHPGGSRDGPQTNV